MMQMRSIVLPSLVWTTIPLGGTAIVLLGKRAGKKWGVVYVSCFFLLSQQKEQRALALAQSWSRCTGDDDIILPHSPRIGGKSQSPPKKEQRALALATVSDK